MSVVAGTKFGAVCDILDKYEYSHQNLIAILQEVQDVYSYLPKDIMTYIGTAMNIPPGTIFGVATFYAHFTLEPKGKYVIKVCDGTACHVKKSGDIIKTIETDLKLGDGKNTTEDLMFTLEVVACIGACGLAPVIMINEDVYGAMDTEKMSALLKKYEEEELANA